MKRLFQPFVLIVTAILGAGYAYVALHLASGVWPRLALALPFLMVWVVPVIYWGSDRDGRGRFDDVAHVMSYLSMAWLSFLLVLALLRDVLTFATAFTPALASAHALLREAGVEVVYAGSVLALIIGMLTALRGPHVRRVTVPIE